MFRTVLMSAIMWFYRGLLPPPPSAASTVTLVVLAALAWMVASRPLFNTGGALAVIDDKFDRM